MPKTTTTWRNHIKAVGAGTLNEPAGMTVIYQNDGSSVINETPGFTLQFAGPTNDIVNSQTVVVDATNPTGSGFAIEQDHYGGAWDNQTRGGLYEPSYSGLTGVTLGNCTEVYARVRFKLNGYTPGGKFFYLGNSVAADDSSYADIYCTVEPSGGMGFRNQGIAGANGWDGFLHWPGTANAPLPQYGTVEGVDWKEVWHVLEFHFVCESAANTGDGYVDVWLNGTLLENAYGDFGVGSHTVNGAYFSEPGGTESSMNGIIIQMLCNQSDTGSATYELVTWGEYYFSGKE